MGKEMRKWRRYEGVTREDAGGTFREGGLLNLGYILFLGGSYIFEGFCCEGQGSVPPCGQT